MSTRFESYTSRCGPPANDALQEGDFAGNATEDYIFFNGERVARRDVSGGAVHYYFSDHLGSTDVVTGNVGVIQKESDYYPYGGEIVVSGSDINNYKFTGKERDSESNLDNFGARYYSSAFGRFMAIDPSGVIAIPGNPQSWNRYSHAYNNPLRFVDRNGKWPTETHGQIIDKAFPGLSDHQKSVLKSSSYWMDHCATCQSHGNAYQHAMRAPGEDVNKANADTNKFVADKVGQAGKLKQESKSTTVGGLPDNALTAAGEAIHASTDKTSPAHTDANGNPREWIISDYKKHNKEESSISDEQMDKAVKAAQEVFGKRLGIN